MVMFFTEQDLVSFGEYMISPVREASINTHPDMTDSEKAERLNSVTNLDLNNWMQFVSRVIEQNEGKRNKQGK